ncbi:hypothetical protein M8J77_015681 [Diaphorina citri]|nr:hypothetical protein M8J77_015681 [Diaphorina citri]
MIKLLLTSLLINCSARRVSCIKNAADAMVDSSNAQDLTPSSHPEASDTAVTGYNRDDRMSRPDRNFIITHEGILNYQPVSRSIHNLDQIYNPTFSRSEVIPVQNDGGHGLSGRALQDNALIQVQSGRDVHGAYTSRDAVSVPLHVGFQVEDPPAGTYRMNPKGKVLNLDDSNGAAADNRYVRKMVARQPSVVARQQNKGKGAQAQSDLSLAESAHEPFAVFGQKVNTPDHSRPTQLRSVHHQPSAHQMEMDQHNSASNAYYRAIPPNQKFLNPYFTGINDLDLGASDPRETFDVFQASGRSGFNGATSGFSGATNGFISEQKHKDLSLAASEPRETFDAFQHGSGGSSGFKGATSGFNSGFSGGQKHKDLSPDETKVYDVNGGGAKSYVDYMTAADLESKKYLSGRYRDIEDAGSGHYEGQVPIHFGFQVEHPRLQYPAKSSFADKYHQDHHIPTVPNHHIADKYHQDHHIPIVPKKIKIPKVPIKTPPAKYNPSVEDVDDDIESDFKHIKIKKYSTNNDELPIPSTYNARYSDEIPNQSRHNFKYVGNQDDHAALELSRSATNDRQIHVPSTQHFVKLPKNQQNYQQLGQSQQASQKYYQYVKPQNLLKKAGTLPVVYY